MFMPFFLLDKNEHGQEKQKLDIIIIIIIIDMICLLKLTPQQQIITRLLIKVNLSCTNGARGKQTCVVMHSPQTHAPRHAL